MELSINKDDGGSVGSNNGLERLNEDNCSTSSDSKTKKGLTLITAVIFIIGEMAGSGILSLPKGISEAGWIGVVVLLFCCLNAGYSGICLAKCWIILEERYPEYREKVRYPYPIIGARAVAPWMRYVISFCVDFSLFGVSTVFLLLSSKMIASICASFGIYFCYWILILAAILCPFMWLGTPKDFWPVAVIAMGTSAMASLLLLIAILTDSNDPNRHYKPPEAVYFTNFFLAFGTITFSFGGASTFPTFQNDMIDKSKFPKAVFISFIGLMLLYTPLSAAGYAVYGNAVESSIIDNIPHGGLRTTIEVLFSVHLFFAFLLVVNTPTQEFEEILNISPKFGKGRIALRTGMLLLVVFVCETMPHFGKILNLMGASTVTLMTYVFPPMFYILLSRQKEWPKRHIPLHEMVYLIEIMIIGIIGGIISTYSAINDIAEPDSFIPPCYVDITVDG